MPKEKKLAVSIFLLIRSKISFSLEMYPSVMTTTLRALSGSKGMERASSSAGSMEVPPPPSSLSIRSIAYLIFFFVAWRDSGDSLTVSSANRTRLKVSVSLRLAARSRMRVLAVSRGKPCMEPDTSSTKRYSRGGISSGVNRSGGCTVSMKYFSFPVPVSTRPLEISSPVSLYFRMKSLFPA